MAQQNPYETLGVAPEATQETIRRAFRKLALRYHPDRNPDPDAARQFARIAEAYEELRDPSKRAQVDRTHYAEKKAAQPKPPPTASAPPPKRTVDPAPIAKLALLFSRGQFEAAEVLAHDILEKDPKEAVAYAVLADISRSRGELNHAVNLYARAVQADPKNATYQRRYEEMLSGAIQTPLGGSPTKGALGAVATVGFIAAMAAIYVAVSAEPSIFTAIPIIGSWTLGLVVMLAVVGLCLGGGLAFGGVVGRFSAVSAVGKLEPIVVLTGLSLLNFWLGLALYLAFGFFQNAFSFSLSRLFAGAFAALTLLVMASSFSPTLIASQVALWGGGPLLLCAVLGWGLLDSTRKP